MDTTAPTGIFRVKQFAERHRAEGWTEPAIRWVIFTQGQELEQAGAVFRLGTRLFVDEVKFYAWLRGQRSSSSERAVRRKPAAQEAVRRGSP
jgi:hypothetical protein